MARLTDRGELPAIRTPGGHWRYDVVDITMLYAARFPEEIAAGLLLTPSEAASTLGVDVDTVLRLVEAGTLACTFVRKDLPFFAASDVLRTAALLPATPARPSRSKPQPVDRPAGPRAVDVRRDSARSMVPYEIGGKLYYDSMQVAILFGVDQRVIARWSAAGRLPYIGNRSNRTARYPKQEIDELLIRSTNPRQE